MPSGPLPIGAGFLGWVLDRPEFKSVEILHEALNIGVRAIWLSFGNDLGHWVDVVRSHDQKAGKDSKTLIFIQVNSAEQALTAVRDWKADVLIAQGCPAGPLSLVSIFSLRLPHLSQASKREDTALLPLHPF